MIIYVSHLRRSNFEKELYEPLKNSSIAKDHQLIFPHEKSDQPFNTRSLFESGKCDLVIAEVSQPATGQGIELGWASMKNIPIICVYKKGSSIASSLKLITKMFIEYSDSTDLIKQVKDVINVETPRWDVST